MNSKWLIKNNSKNLIIFFNGWSLDEKIVKHLNSIEHDVLMFNNYENFEISKNILSSVNNYEKRNIIAWSFGVWACCNVMEMLGEIDNAAAINGTPVPVDNNFGIPHKIFNMTLAGLSEKTYPKFFQNMFNSKISFKDLMPERDIENQKHELIQIQKSFTTQDVSKKSGFFNRVFIGVQDKIFPAKNQFNFWNLNSKATIIELNQGHYIAGFKNWEEIFT